MLPWLGRSVPTARGRRRNPLSTLSRWKVFDNLRRSLIAPSLVLWLLWGWFVLPAFAWAVTLAAVVVVAFPLFVQSLSVLLAWPRGVDWRRHLRDSAADLWRTLLQSLLSIVFLFYKAQLMADAVLRTLWRLYVSRRRLLEWETADAAERRLKGAWSTLWEMGPSALVAAALAAVVPAESRLAAYPLLVAWVVAPAVAIWISRLIAWKNDRLTASQRRSLRMYARKTWAFFEAFVGEEDNYLPPDNFQEYPKAKVAHRVSPTNTGMYIISAIAARDFRYLGLTDLGSLLHRNLESLERLDRFRGHFYNWYDTTNLAPLLPRYVSTADSGNLAVCLLTAGQGLHDVLREPLFGGRLNDGMLDSVAMVEEALMHVQPHGARFVSPAIDALESGLRDVRKALSAPASDALAWRFLLDRLQPLVGILPDRLRQFEQAVGLEAKELTQKLKLLARHVWGAEQDGEYFFPWLEVARAGFTSTEVTARGKKPAPRWALDEPELKGKWDEIWSVLAGANSAEAIAKLHDRAGPSLAALRDAVSGSSLAADTKGEIATWLDALAASVRDGALRAEEFCQSFGRLAQRYETIAIEMDFTILYNSQRRLFSVGLNLEDNRLDRSHYDLLASEARLASLVAIAKGDVDHRHWFQLGRMLTETAGRTSVLSWGGTMFEYLMPPLFARDVPGSLLDQSCQAAVARQIEYGRQRRVPWGISESAFGALSVTSDYHYQSFGTPGLGLKRGLAKDLVISPYSTALALEIDPRAAAANFISLVAAGAEGPWGFYDALDYTPERVPQGKRNVVVACYMAHHHGMTLAALANRLLDRVLQRRFQRHRLPRATELLLEERIPVSVLQFQPHGDEVAAVPIVPEVVGPVSRKLLTAATSVPRAHFLSNGQYSVMITNAGSGYSSWRNTAVTRWRCDATRDAWGQFLYVRDLKSGRVWSAGFQPTLAAAYSYEVIYSLDKAEIRRRDGDVETHLEVAVSPENNAEVRQVTFTNHGTHTLDLEVTSYAEVVLAPGGADLAHPAFSKLFVETDYLADHHALTARRRPRDATQSPLWAVHVLAVEPGATPPIEFETDRARFLGRGGTVAAPAAMQPAARLSQTVGPVLDPIFSLRTRVQVERDRSVTLAFVTALAETREEALLLADQYHDLRVVQRTLEVAWAHSQIELRHLHISPETAQLYQRLASAVLFPEPLMRAPSSVLMANRLNQTGLWRHGVSGDDPIVLVRITQPDQRALLREVLLAHEFWHLLGLKVDLVVLNEHAAGYFDVMHEQLLELVQATVRMPLGKPGGVYLLRGAHLSPEDRTLFEAVAAISLHGERGSLERQADRSLPPVRRPERLPTRVLRRRFDRPATE
ncbi:MAG: glucoamylase family protein, partial [Pirellulales bacterium]